MINLYPECIGRTVIYRDKHGDSAEEGVITSYNHEGIVFVRYGSDKFSQATRQQDLEWMMSDEKGTPATKLTPEQSNRILNAEKVANRGTEERQLRQWCILQAIEAHKAHPIADIPMLAVWFHVIMTEEKPAAAIHGIEKSGAD